MAEFLILHVRAIGNIEHTFPASAILDITWTSMNSVEIRLQGNRTIYVTDARSIERLRADLGLPRSGG